jgi:acetyl-CoA acetyltransferase/uncharacterized OB-fold protein
MVDRGVADPLPELTERNRFFWTGGADGVLRFQRCTACAQLVHPPSVACHYCRCGELTVTEVSGRATVLGVTVNHQAWLPGQGLPYVLAAVGVDEDPRVRLTTRIVGTEPDRVRIGQRVRVEFVERRPAGRDRGEPVWLPYFRPLDEPDADELPPLAEEPERVRTWTRPPLSGKRYEHDCAITGVGASRLGRRLMADPLALTVDACRAAVEDAGLTLDDIDGLATYPGGTVVGGFSEGGLTGVEAALRLRPAWHTGGAELPGPGGSLVAAMLAVSAGLARHVLCYRTVWQATWTELARTGRISAGGGGRIGPPMDTTVPMGAHSPANVLAINASHYLRRYGGSRETLGWIALNARANAARHPQAIYREPLTMADYLAARTVSTPFGLYDCDVPCDGSIAVVVSAVETAADLRQPPVLVNAAGTQVSERVDWDQSTLTHEPQVLGTAAHLWSRTDLRPSDVDLAQLYDGFTFNCLSWLEALGFCGIGEAPAFLDGGKSIALDGEIPLNTHGGQLSHGRTHGFGLVQEAILQLRGDAGDRQVRDAEVAVVSSGGLTPSSALLLTRAR